MSIFYISDLHFGHQNVIKFDNRPYADTDEMDRDMIRKWNDRVGNNDDVYVVGDFAFRSGYDPAWYLQQLSGHKHLIVGNHDGKMLKNKNAMKYWETVDNLTSIQDGDKSIILCHFPILEWNQMRHWHLLVYGHIHANTEDDTYKIMKKYRPYAYNAAACINGYQPVMLDELIANNQRFQEEH